MTWQDRRQQRIHERIYYYRGHPSKHSCIECDKQAAHWTWMHDTDDENIFNYEPRCISHHRLYDKMSEGEKNGRAKLTEEDVIEIREKYASGKYSQVNLAYIYGVHQSHISRIVNNGEWKHI
jgi:hypothetical protein